EGKQKIIIELYDKFFKNALPKTVGKLGIVYTPVEVVDFIIHSVSDVLKKEFGRNISDENIHVLDPFTGTGTFITRLLQSGLIKEKDLIRKYTKELHANEIVLLAYYIASINIENAFHDLMQSDDYTGFDGICLTDTFQLGEMDEDDIGKLFSDVFPYNSTRLLNQQNTPIRIIMGNPPYSVGQTSANDNAQNESYPKLEQRLADTYVAGTKATNKNAIYDSYIKAFRWASDRLDKDHGGIIGFVSNAGWLDGAAMDGMRSCLQEEFDSIYVFNLRGNARTQGETRRREAGNVFGGGSRTPVAITILVKNPKQAKEKADIFYVDIGDYLSREDKLSIISDYKSCMNRKFSDAITVLKPNEYND
ncbi:MAG: N-6 DNA methylase, partial [Anaerovibrio sp.]|nr:N-6 DNA methylase [Anaerovibrio sp.]